MLKQLQPTPEVLEAIKLEGFLEKAKPDSFISMYQKRYCKFIENGRILAYAEKKEDYDKGLMKGQIPIKDILDIQIESSHPKRFEVLVEGRAYKFEAKTAEEAKKWVSSLKTAQTYACNWDQTWEAALKDLNSEFFVEETIDDPKAKTEFFILQPISFLKNTAKKVVVDAAVGTAVGIVKKGVNTVNELLADVKPRSNDEYLKAKKFNELFDNIDPSILKSRIIMGFLLRDTKGIPGVNLVDNLMSDTGMKEVLARRWCLLISSKPLFIDEADPKDEVTLEQGQIPIELEFDTLYMFDEVCDNSPHLDAVPMKDVIQVVMRKKVQAEILYRFVLDLGDHKFNLVCPSFSEIDRWLRAVQTSRAIVKEYQLSALPTLKNINCLINIKDGENGEAVLLKKINSEYDGLIKGGEVMTVADVQALAAVQKKVAYELMNVINACLADRHKRIDIIKLYQQVFHENILTSLKAYFKRNSQDLQNGDIFEMMKFLKWYQDSLTVFGLAFKDPRIRDGLRTLGHISAIRILKTNLKPINNILKGFVTEKPNMDARGCLATQTPKDVFKVLNETLNTVSLCNMEPFALLLFKTCQHILEYFQSGLEILVKEGELGNEFLIAACNDVMTFVGELKSFVSQLENLTTYPANKLGAYFDSEALSKRFVMIGTKSREKLGENIFTPIAAQEKDRGFLQLDLEAIVQKALKAVDEWADKIAQNHVPRLRGVILQHIVAFYVQSFLKSCEKKTVKKENLNDALGRFKKAKEILKSSFDSTRVDVNKIMSSIEDCEDFLTRSYAMLTLGVQALKSSYGDSLKWATIELLLRLREDTIPADKREEIMQSCKDIYKMTEKTEADKKFDVFKKVEQNSDAVLDKPSQLVEHNTIDLNEEAEMKGKGELIHALSESKKLSLDGYLTVDSNFVKDVMGVLAGKKETRYFSLRKDCLYCYKDKKSEVALKTINLKEAVDCFADNENVKFVLRVKRVNGSMKDLKLIADSEGSRNEWIRAIKEAMNLDGKQEDIKLGVVDTNFYKDTTPMFSDIEKMPSLTYEFVKPKKAAVVEVTKNSAATAGTEQVKRAPAPVPETSGSQPTPVTPVSVVNKEISSGKRKKSISMNPDDDTVDETVRNTYVEIQPTQPSQAKPGLCALFCMKLNFFGGKSSS